MALPLIPSALGACGALAQQNEPSIDRVVLSDAAGLGVFAKYIGFGDQGSILINVTDIENQNDTIELRLCDASIDLKNAVDVGPIDRVVDIGIKVTEDYCDSGVLEISYGFQGAQENRKTVSLRYEAWDLSAVDVY